MVESDVELVLTWRNHQEVRRYMYTKHEISPDEHNRWFECSRQDPCKNLLIFEDEDQPIGFVSFNKLEHSENANWGFYLAPYAPKGLGRRLGVAALDHAFNELKLHKVCGQVLAYNERSIQFHQSFGFKQEGVFHKQNIHDECYNSVINFGLLNHEWQPGK